jgi:hypothetical protein
MVVDFWPLSNIKLRFLMLHPEPCAGARNDRGKALSLGAGCSIHDTHRHGWGCKTVMLSQGVNSRLNHSRCRLIGQVKKTAFVGINLSPDVFNPQPSCHLDRSRTASSSCAAERPAVRRCCCFCFCSCSCSCCCCCCCCCCCLFLVVILRRRRRICCCSCFCPCLSLTHHPKNLVILSEASRLHRDAQSKNPDTADPTTTFNHFCLIPL